MALAAQFEPLAGRLAEAEEQIVAELTEIQGSPVEIGGYYLPDPRARRGSDAPERRAQRVARGRPRAAR